MILEYSKVYVVLIIFQFFLLPLSPSKKLGQRGAAPGKERKNEEKEGEGEEESKNERGEK